MNKKRRRISLLSATIGIALPCMFISHIALADQTTYQNFTAEKSYLVSVKHNTNCYTDTHFQNNKSVLEGQCFETNGYIIHNNQQFQKLYHIDGKHNKQFYGYINKKELAKLSFKKEEKMVTTIQHYKRYNDFFWTKRGDVKLGQNFKTRGYYCLGNGNKYYSLSWGDGSWAGYINASALKDLTLKKEEDLVSIKKIYNRYNTFFWAKRGNVKLGQNFKTRGYYRLGDGSKYYSLSWSDGSWAGYINANALQPLRLKKEVQLVSIKKEYNRYNTFFWAKRGNVKLGQNFKTRGYYCLGNGNKYYSLSWGDGSWAGYINANALTPLTLHKEKQKLMIAKPYKRYNNFFWDFRGNTKSGQVFTTRGYYRLGDGSKYYSLSWNDGSWAGYVNANTFKGYQNPKPYYQIQYQQIKPYGKVGYNIGLNYEGIKTYLVMRALGTSNGYNCYNWATYNAVKNFQARHHLPVTGIVDKKTWTTLGFSSSSWTSIDSYIAPLQVKAWEGRKAHIEAMINQAYKYLGNPYIEGASSSPKYGVDCSGLVMQALYAGGINPAPISSINHASPGNEYNSRNLWASSRLKRVPYRDRQRGDLIFYYQPGTTTIWHVAIYLGNNKVIESWPPKVVIWPIVNSQHSVIAGVKRPFL